jgi:hypothetical protein
MATLSNPGWYPQIPVMESTHVKRNNVENSCESSFGDNLSMDTIMDLGVPAVNRGNSLMDKALECLQQYQILSEIVGSTADCLDLDELVNRAIDVSNVPGFESFWTPVLKIAIPTPHKCSCGCEAEKAFHGRWLCDDCIDTAKHTCYDCGCYGTKITDGQCINCANGVRVCIFCGTNDVMWHGVCADCI